MGLLGTVVSLGFGGYSEPWNETTLKVRFRSELISRELKIRLRLGEDPDERLSSQRGILPDRFAGLQPAETATPAAEVIRDSFSLGATWRRARIANRAELRSRSRFPRNSVTHSRLATPAPSKVRRTTVETTRGSVPSSFDYFSRSIHEVLRLTHNHLFLLFSGKTHPRKNPP
jgi:hypothetical protein